MTTLAFELIDSNDGLVAKRARVPGGWVYLFEGIDYETQSATFATSCFVPDAETQEQGDAKIVRRFTLADMADDFNSRSRP